MFPPPPANMPSRDQTVQEEREIRLRPVGIHFLRNGDLLLASYLAHGIM